MKRTLSFLVRSYLRLFRFLIGLLAPSFERLSQCKTIRHFLLFKKKLLKDWLSKDKLIRNGSDQRIWLKASKFVREKKLSSLFDGLNFWLKRNNFLLKTFYQRMQILQKQALFFVSFQKSINLYVWGWWSWHFKAWVTRIRLSRLPFRLIRAKSFESNPR